MCLSADGGSPLSSVGRGGGNANAAQWTVDQRPFVWGPLTPASEVQNVWESDWVVGDSVTTSCFCTPPLAPVVLPSYSQPQQVAAGPDAAIRCKPGTSRMSTVSEVSPLVHSREGEKSTWPKELVQQAALAPHDAATSKLTNPTAGGRSVRTRSQKPKLPARSDRKGEVSTTDVCTSASFSDNEGTDDDEPTALQDADVISEKRRRRMLSNRASARRSRQRRQERLDTLEVLVAQLRVKNDALTRKANRAALTAKRFEEENKSLRDHLEKQESARLSSGSNDTESVENMPPTVCARNGMDASCDVEQPGLEAVPRIDLGEDGMDETFSVHEEPQAQGQSCENRCLNAEDANAITQMRLENFNEESCEEFRLQETWGIFASPNFSPVFPEVAGKPLAEASSETIPLQCRGILDCTAQECGVMTDVAMVDLEGSTGVFEALDPFEIGAETEPKNLDSAEEIWLESLADLLTSSGQNFNCGM